MSEFAHCFPYPITYLDPYKLKLESPKDLVDWFEVHADSNEKICIIAHSLGGDLARYLASNMSQITNLVLLDGGYLDMEHILSLEQEIEETLAYLKQQVFPSLEEAVASELGDTDNPSPATIKAIQSSYRWNPELHHYELDLDPQAVLSLLRLRRELRSFQAPLIDTKVMFIGPKYEEDSEWRAKALENLDPSIKKVLLKDQGHDFYTAVPELVNKEIITWIQICS
ncbi:alpha/beta hydrolase [Streptococcus xiaochunlingii]|uniref:acyl-CoA thioester hydrolase/BAAT C-terminal domain-containing protein n=1 Tax=Streptococcus xiaochunlingii TaxID=2589788 RepID=UPI002554C928|nr:alpha/beta hydrolase [Streptococcus xiaochunlingii]MDK8778465.1 alpha/beta hydrolase [Streptococcus xiaochunlingii]